MKERGVKESGVIDYVLELLLAVAIFGWVWNIVKIISSDFGQITALLALRIAGVIWAPIGAVLGYL